MSINLLAHIVEYAPCCSLAFAASTPFARVQVENSDGGYRGADYTISCRPAPSYLSEGQSHLTDAVLMLSLEGPTLSPSLSYAMWWLAKCNTLHVCLSSRSLCYDVDLSALFREDTVRVVGIDFSQCKQLHALCLPASAAAHLAALCLEQCESLRAVSIHGGATALRCLTHVNVSWCAALQQYRWLTGSPLLRQLLAREAHSAEVLTGLGWHVPPSMYEMQVHVEKEANLKCLNSKNNAMRHLEVEGLLSPRLSPTSFKPLRELCSLTLSEVTVSSVSFVQHMPHLQTVALLNCKTLEDISALGAVPCLRRLQVVCATSCLSFRWMNQANVQHLEELEVNTLACGSGVDLSVLGEIGPTSLRSLTATLAAASSSSSSVDWLRELFSLESLSLEFSYETVDAMAAVGQLPLLTDLNLSKCRGADISWLRGAGSLKSLKARGCKDVRDFSAISHLHSLEVLDLSENTLQEVTFLAPCTHLRELNLALCTPGSGAAPPHATVEGPESSCFPQLESLTLSNAICPWAGWLFANAPQLRRMDAVWAKELPSLAAAAAHPALEQLLLTRTQCDAERWTWLGACHHLQRFSLRGCAFAGAPLDALAHLTDVEVSSCAGLADLRWLAAAVPHLQKLNLSNCRQLAALDVLRGAAQLRELDLSGTAVADLTWLRADSEATELPAAICGALRQLALSSTAIADLGALASCPHLQELRLHACTAVTDFSVLSRTTAVLQLDVSSTTMVDLTWVTEALLLHTLNIGLCSIRDIGALAKLPHLEHLYAESCAVTSLQVLKRCPQLKMVDVRGCAHIHNYANDIKGFHGNILTYFNVM